MWGRRKEVGGRRRLTFTIEPTLFVDHEVDILTGGGVAAGVDVVLEGHGVPVRLADMDGGTATDAAQPVSELEGVGQRGAQQYQQHVLW